MRDNRFEELSEMMRKLVVMFLVLAGPLLGGEGEKQRVQTTNTERVSFQPGGIIRLENSFGALTVEGWDRPEVEITVTKSIDREYEPKQREQAAKRLERVHVNTQRRSDTELAISTTTASRRTGVTLQYEIHAPRNSQLLIHHRGFVLVSDITGDVEATNRHGDIVLMIPNLSAHSIDARSKMGTVSADVPGTTHVKHLVGKQFGRTADASSHRISLRTGFGGITLKEQ
jgi:hypothetical protein